MKRILIAMAVLSLCAPYSMASSSDQSVAAQVLDDWLRAIGLYQTEAASQGEKQKPKEQGPGRPDVDVEDQM